ncbi:F510_1955 family glycosylhydrolase [Neobacillus sp. NPDC058068]|uniref:F510_1955 family glycosylhydrolase n=1 Tax=Neobacillus sp. NPDC058068 TaxID=3346325 RepID=UPI0036DB738E
MKLQLKLMIAILSGILLIASGCSNKSGETKKTNQENKAESNANFEIVEAKSFKVKNIRGIGYPGNDNALYLVANDGLKMYSDGKWTKTTTNQHDYIGFQALETGFLSSGHPQKGTDFSDPLGLVQSTDKGKTLKKLALYGKTNFHFIASSFSGNGLYVISEQPNDALSLGVNYSTDNGGTWKKSVFKDFNADSLGMMAVHPNNGAIMAMSTRSGIYYSTDNGNTMKLITDPIMVTALTFIGDSILFSSVENEQILLKTLNPASGDQTRIAFPYLDYDNPITYLTVNPKNTNQMAFTTYKNDLYESIDGGKKWSNLLSGGIKEQE